MAILNLVLIALLLFLGGTKNKLSNVRLVLKNTALFEFAWATFLFLLLIFQLSVVTEQSESGLPTFSAINKEVVLLLSSLFAFGVVHLCIFIFLAYMLKKGSTQK